MVPTAPGAPPLQALQREGSGSSPLLNQRANHPKLPNELTSLLKFPPELRSLLLKSDPDTDDLDLLDPIAEAEDEALEDAMRGYPMPRFKSP